MTINKSHAIASWLALSMFLAACAAPTAAPQEPKGSTALNGSGATFPQPLYEDWAFAYSQLDPSVLINYAGGGSGQGKTDITKGTVDYAGSDAALSDAEAATKPLVQLPSVAGAVVAIFNIPDVTTTVVLDGQVLGDIYSGKIEKWNDAAIVKLNPKLTFPDLPINVVHRADGSGTSSIFTTYLCAANANWKAAVNPCKGTTVDWPVDKLKRGQGGRGNQGVAAAVQKTSGAIGYVELAYAKNNGIDYAQMINSANKQVDATVASTTAATVGAAFSDRNSADIVNVASADAWPISGFTYLIVAKDFTDCKKAGKLLQFFNWVLTDSAAISRAGKLLYSPLGDDAKAKSLAALKTVTCNGQPVLK